ncbi:hypothetical protein Salat_2114600 [Sesamum alatum]|uniref:Uncharacterized protein n=1 Tax=Sesamum alatum TaxID=300844 RepID=A0AAE2CGX3_9LAMI|nr:hypothetical protein Salat_2114600 [Sesamum alatum]
MNAYIANFSRSLRGNPPTVATAPSSDADASVVPSGGDPPGRSSEHPACSNQAPATEEIATADTNIVVLSAEGVPSAPDPEVEVEALGSKEIEIAKVVKDAGKAKKCKHKHKNHIKSSSNSSKRSKSCFERRAAKGSTK